MCRFTSSVLASRIGLSNPANPEHNKQRVLPYLFKVPVRRPALPRSPGRGTILATKRASYKGESLEMDVVLKVYKIKSLPVLPTSGMSVDDFANNVL